MNIKLTAAALLISSSAAAHEMTPTYPEFKYSYVEGVLSTSITLFNRREDVSYYEIGVFDEDFNNIPFATNDRIVEIRYLQTKTFEIYIRKKDETRVEYICTTSKNLKEDVTTSGITSRICSRIK